MRQKTLMKLTDEELSELPQSKSVLNEYKRRWHKALPDMMKEAGIIDECVRSGELILEM